MRLRRVGCSLVVSMLLAGCSSDAATLIVQVRTDLGPGVEFDEALTMLEGPAGAPRELTLAASAERDWGGGVRVAEWSDLPAGTYRVNVTLRGAVTLSRPARVEIGAGELRVVTLLITRDCVSVECPAPAGDPAAAACLAGRCVPEECTEERPDLCPMPECDAVRPCTDPVAPCARIECTPTGSCFTEPRHDRCLAGQVCHPQDGCEGGAVDAAVPDGGSDGGVSMGPWRELAGSASDGGFWTHASLPMDPAIVLDGSGNPLIAWAERGEILVVRFNGVAWEELGAGAGSGVGISNTAGNSQTPTIALAPAGAPVVAWHDGSSVYVRRFDSAGWLEIGSGSASASGIGTGDEPALAVDTTGRSVVAWHHTATEQIYVLRNEGGGWSGLGGSDTGGGLSVSAAVSAAPAIAIDSADQVSVAWEEEVAGSMTEIYLRRWDGAVWQELAGSYSSGGVSGATGNSTAPTIAIQDANVPVVAWEERFGLVRQIYSRWFAGAAWSERGVSASLGGVSDNRGGSLAPALAFRPSTTLVVVAWQDTTAGNVEIYVRAPAPSTWDELGSGSAADGGISNTSGSSSRVAIASSSVRTCAVWVEEVSLYLRCIEEP